MADVFTKQGKVPVACSLYSEVKFKKMRYDNVMAI